jgi:hypothetical protein
MDAFKSLKMDYDFKKIAGLRISLRAEHTRLFLPFS